MHRVYFVEYTLENGSLVRMCLQSTNAYGNTNVWDLYDTNSFKISLLVCDNWAHRPILEMLVPYNSTALV